MPISDLTNLALKINTLYDEINAQKNRPNWTAMETTEGLVCDVGDLVKLMQAKFNKRAYKGELPLDEALKHEVCDVLWSVLVLADQLNFDLESEFVTQMKILQERLQKQV